MLKKTISIFLTVLFLGIILTPSIIASIDDSIDISVLFSLSEEEEIESLKLVISENDEELSPMHSSLELLISGYRFKNFPKPHLNLISPPPEYYNIL